MYWYKSIKLLCSVVLCTSGLVACRPDVHEDSGSKRYFDLKGFINADSARLMRVSIRISKTVKHNNNYQQTKDLIITNWGQELVLFSASDINKLAWRDSYKIKNEGDSVVYTATDPQLTTRRMAIQTTNGRVVKININNFTKNMLYQTTEHLVYYPDSLYIIDKLQQVKLIGSNRYIITGKIK